MLNGVDYDIWVELITPLLWSKGLWIYPKKTLSLDVQSINSSIS
jgi:hypothetical protein